MKLKIGKKVKPQKTNKPKRKKKKGFSFKDKLPRKAYTPLTNQQCMSYLFQEIEGNYMKISDDIYSICLEYEDISFAKADDAEAEDIFLKWVSFLNSFSENTHIQVTNAGTPVDTKLYKEDYIIHPHEGYTDVQNTMVSEFNELIGNAIGNKQDTLETKRFITLSQKASSFEEAKNVFYVMLLKADEKFRNLKSNISVVEMNERLIFLHDFFNIETAHAKGITNIVEYAKEHDLTIYDVLAPKEKMSFREKDYVELIPDEPEGRHKFFRVLYLDPKLPTSMTPKFYNEITTMSDVHLITTLNIQPTNTAKSIDKVSKKLSGLETERYDKIKKLAKSNINYEYVKDKKLENAIKNAEKLKEDMTKNDQKVFQNNFLVCVIADTYTKLEEATMKIQDKAGERLLKMYPVYWQQLEAIQNVLPLGHNTIAFQRTLTSEATGVNVPFNSKDFMHKNGIFGGINEVSKNGVFIDRKRLINGNGAILATSGAGKSFTVKLTAEQIFLRYPEDDIIFIDYQKEYEPIVSALSGQTIQFSDHTDTHINPFDLSADYDLSEDGKSSPIKSKIEYIQAWVESIIDAGALSAIEKTVIDRCTMYIYRGYEKSGFQDITKLPKIYDFYQCLMEQPEKEAKALATGLERFAKGSQDIFAHDTNVDIQNRVVCFDISELSASIQAAGYLVVLDHIMNRLSSNRKKGKYTWLFIDEFHILLGNEGAANYVAKIYKIGRKFLAMNTVITQNITDVLNSEQGRKILSNSEFAMLLKQKPLDIAAVSDIFNISEAEARYLGGDSKPGQGVVVFGSDKIPFYNPIPKSYTLYALNNTDGKQMER